MALGAAADLYWQALGRLVIEGSIHHRLEDASSRLFIVDDKTVPEPLQSEHQQLVRDLREAVGRGFGQEDIALPRLASRIYSMTYRLVLDDDAGTA